MTDHGRQPGGPGVDTPAQGNRPASIALVLQLPYERDSVPLGRHLVRQTLVAVGVVDDIVDEIELALSEGCTNVLHHAGPGTTYEVALAVRGDRCELQVLDRGRGFDHESVRDRPAATTAEGGRGLAIMEAVMDRIEFASAPEQGTRVTLTKRLSFQPGSAGRGLLPVAAEEGV